MDKVNFEPYFRALDRLDPFLFGGEVTEMVGLLIESRGPAVALGDFCEVQTSTGL